MPKRKITKFDDLKFEPFDRYGKVIPGMSWHLVSYDKKTQYGTYISKLEPGTKTIPHIHTGYEEFMILEGELIDSDGTIFKKGDLIVCSNQNKEIAKGFSNFNSFELKQIIGLKSEEINAKLGYTSAEEVIHRDNLVLS